MSRGARSSRPHRHGKAQQQALVRAEISSAHAKIARSDEALAAQEREAAANLKSLAADIQDTKLLPTQLCRPSFKSTTSLVVPLKAPPSCWAPPNLTSRVLPRRVNPVNL